MEAPRSEAYQTRPQQSIASASGVGPKPLWGHYKSVYMGLVKFPFIRHVPYKPHFYYRTTGNSSPQGRARRDRCGNGRVPKNS